MKWLLLKMFCLGSLWVSPVFADQFHYINVLQGERASGLGGAFTAVADDASAVVYNPAGIGFALANDISGSATAFQRKTITYKDAVLGDDFKEEVEGALSPFVGGLGKLEHISPGLVFAFGIYSTDSELKDQDTLIDTSSLRFHRTSNIRANTNKYGIALAKRFGSSFSIGFGLSFIKIDELVQEYQDVTSAVQNSESNDNIYIRYLTQNIRQHLVLHGLEPALGMQLAFGGSFSVGLAIKKGIVLNQNFESQREQTVVYRSNDTGEIVDHSEVDNASTFRTESLPSGETNPMDLPMEIRTGFAWFASTSFLLTTDVIYHTEAKGDVSFFDREPTLNYALGTEYYISPSYPIRFGYFTNNDARDKPSSGKTNQRDSFDYNGLSLFVAMVQPNSQVGIGVTHQIGKGEAQKIANSSDIQDIEASFTTVGFTVSHSF